MAGRFLQRIADLSVIGQEVLRDPTTGGISIADTDDTATVFRSQNLDGTPGFRIQFNVDKNIEGTPNPTEITIWNLGEASRSLFQRENSRVVLRAGYETADDLQVIFQGNIQRTRTEKSGPDYVTKIRAAESIVAWQNSTINQSFGQPTSLTDAITSLSEALSQVGVGTDTSAGLPSKTYQSGIVLSGNTMKELEKIITSENLEFSIQENQLVILPAGATREGNTFVLSVDTGMVGIPQIGDNSMTVKSLLNPRLRVYNQVLINSQFVNGLYRIAKVVHKGDTFEGDYITELECDVAFQDLGIATGPAT